MLFTDEDSKTTFEVPDNPTGRDMLAYDAQVENPTAGSMYERLWNGLCEVATKWESETLPELKPEVLDGEMTPAQLAVVKWAGLSTFTWARRKRDVPKN